MKNTLYIYIAKEVCVILGTIPNIKKTGHETTSTVQSWTMDYHKVRFYRVGQKLGYSYVIMRFTLITF